MLAPVVLYEYSTSRFSGLPRTRLSDLRTDRFAAGRRHARATLLLSFGLVANLAAQMTFAATLREIAAKKPRDLKALGEVQGVGAVKLERYGEAMLQALSTNG